MINKIEGLKKHRGKEKENNINSTEVIKIKQLNNLLHEKDLQIAFYKDMIKKISQK